MRILLAVVVVTLAIAQEKFPIVEITVDGIESVSADVVIAETGLKIGQPIMPADLEQAVKKLSESGFFRDVRFRYRPRDGGYAVRFDVLEEPREAALRIDLPGVDGKTLLAAAEKADPLVRAPMPETGAAEARYINVLQQEAEKLGFKSKIIARNEADLSTGKRTVLFRPDNLPRITTVRFTGNQAVPSDALEKAMARVAIGQEFTEREFRLLLDFNVVPLYENAARHMVRFPAIRTTPAATGVAIEVSVDEGGITTLADVKVSGDAIAEIRHAAQFAVGAPARWDQITIAMQRGLAPLREQGHLDAMYSEVERKLDPQTNQLSLALKVDAGPVYLFRELRLKGVSAKDEQRVRALWKLAPGAAFRASALNEFVSKLAGLRLPVGEIQPAVQRIAEQ
jgi:outer membrane protein assembly factor BamA